MVKNNISLFLQALLVLYLVTSCSPSPSKEKIKALDSVSPANQEILFWYQAGTEEEVVIKEMIKGFNESNEYEITVIGDNRGFYEDIWAVISDSDSAPDIFWIIADERKELPWRDELGDLFPFLLHSKWGGKVDISPEITEKMGDSFGGYLFKSSESGWVLPGIPVLHDPSLVFCNTDRLNDLGYDNFPGSKDEFRQICEAAGLLKNTGGLIYPPDSSTWLTVAYADGWNPVDKKGDIIEDEESLFASGNFLFNLHKAGASFPAEKKFSGQMEFSGGYFIFSVDAASGARYYGESIEASINPFTWSVNSFPSPDEGGFTGAWDRTAAILPASPEKMLAAWIFVKWSLRKDIQAKLARSAGIIPVNPESLDMLIDETDPDSIYGLILEIGKLNDIRPFPWTGETEVFYDLVTDEIRTRLDIVDDEGN